MKYKFRSCTEAREPLKFIDRIVRASTDRGDTVWEPVRRAVPGCRGPATHRAAANRAAETNAEFYTAAVERLKSL